MDARVVGPELEAEPIDVWIEPGSVQTNDRRACVFELRRRIDVELIGNRWERTCRICGWVDRVYAACEPRLGRRDRKVNHVCATEVVGLLDSSGQGALRLASAVVHAGPADAVGEIQIGPVGGRIDQQRRRVELGEDGAELGNIAGPKAKANKLHAEVSGLARNAWRWERVGLRPARMGKREIKNEDFGLAKATRIRSARVVIERSPIGPDRGINGKGDVARAIHGGDDRVVHKIVGAHVAVTRVVHRHPIVIQIKGKPTVLIDRIDRGIDVRRTGRDADSVVGVEGNGVECQLG